MGKKNVTIRLDEDDIKTFVALYHTSSNGVTIAANDFLLLREKTLKELENLLSETELKILVKCLSKLDRKKTYMVRANLLLHLEEYLEEALKNNADFSTLHKKVEKLTNAQAYFLMDTIFIFTQSFEQLKNILLPPPLIQNY
jgi:hypothetical protein